jgi:hypothetical protein
MIGSFSFLEVQQSAFIAETLFVDGMISSYEGDYQILSSAQIDVGVTSTASLYVSQDLVTPGMISYMSTDPLTEEDSATIFYGYVDFSSATVEGLNSTHAGPKHLAARVDADGTIAYNSGFTSIGVSPEATNRYEYVFADPIMGAEYSVVATSNDNRNNIHCNVIQLNAFGFVIETGKNATKPFACSHSVQVTHN